MTEERHQVHDEIRRVSAAGSAFENIRLSYIAAAERSRQISGSMVEQLQRTQEVVRAIRQVSTIATRIRDRNESIRSKTTDLAETAQDQEEIFSSMYHCGDLELQTSTRRLNAESGKAGKRRRGLSEATDELFEAVKDGEFSQWKTPQTQIFKRAPPCCATNCVSNLYSSQAAPLKIPVTPATNVP